MHEACVGDGVEALRVGVAQHDTGPQLLTGFQIGVALQSLHVVGLLKDG